MNTGKYSSPWIYFEVCLFSTTADKGLQFFLIFFSRLLNLKQRRTFSNEIIKSHILICCVYMDQDILSILKAKCAGYLQCWTPRMPSGVRICYSSWCVIQANVSHSCTTTSRLLAHSQIEMMLTWESLFQGRSMFTCTRSCHVYLQLF